MLLITQLITALFITCTMNAFAHPNHRPTTPQPRQYEGTEEEGILHYEGDLPDNLANPLDSTDDELDEEIEEIQSHQYEK